MSGSGLKAVQMFTQSVLTMTLGGEFSYFPHFTVEEGKTPKVTQLVTSEAGVRNWPSQLGRNLPKRAASVIR